MKLQSPPGAVAGPSRGPIDGINEQFCQKRLLQEGDAAGVKCFLPGGLTIDRRHKNDR